jgi:hypothetical protein
MERVQLTTPLLFFSCGVCIHRSGAGQLHRKKPTQMKTCLAGSNTVDRVFRNNTCSRGCDYKREGRFNELIENKLIFFEKLFSCI